MQFSTPTNPGHTMTRKERKKGRRIKHSIEPHHWNELHLRAIGAELRFRCDFPSSDPPQELLIAIVCTDSISPPAFRARFPTCRLAEVADMALWLEEIRTTPYGPDDQSRYNVSNGLVRSILLYLCPSLTTFYYGSRSLRLHCGKVAVSWRPVAFVGTHLWLVVPENPLPNFAEEVAFAVSIAQEFGIDPSEREFEVWLVSVRKAKVAVVHATISYSFLEAADQSTSPMRPGLVIGELGDVKVEVSKELRLMDLEGRTQFACIVNDVAKGANSRDDGEVNLVANSWK